jgi:hypothetical protein
MTTILAPFRNDTPDVVQAEVLTYKRDSALFAAQKSPDNTFNLKLLSTLGTIRFR